MIIGTYSGTTYERVEPAKPHREVEQPQPLCQRCSLNPQFRQGLCSTCIGYKKRHGVDRPMELIEKARERHCAPRWCKVCGNPNLASRGRCGGCATYWETHRRERPQRFWNPDFRCLTCGIPKRLARKDHTGRLRFYGGRCEPCYSYLYRRGVERPKHLWGIGSKGWCECSNPAEHQIDGFNLCNRCVEEFK